MLTYIVAKKDRANIDNAELAAFRELATQHEKLTSAQLTALLTAKEFEEICRGNQA